MAEGERFLTAPNLLTLSRVPIAALLWLRPYSPAYVLSLMFLAGVTDVLDGWLQRRTLKAEGRSADQAPRTGLWLDPICDKTFALSVLALVWVTRRPEAYLLLLIAAREIIQIVEAFVWKLAPVFKSRSFDFQASLSGKLTTIGQFFAIAAILTGHPSQVPLALVTGALGIATAVFYFLRAWRDGKKGTLMTK
jgi:phosphatidylglycerophosphate synthase